VGRPDARSADILSPEGVIRSFQVSLYKVEPTEAVLARDLLAKDFWRTADVDEVEPVRPEVPLVRSPASSACRAERLAGTRTSPDGPVIWPSGASKGIAPDSYSGESMELRELADVFGRQVSDVAAVNDAWRDQALGDQVFESVGRIGLDLVVERGHQWDTINI